MKLMNISITEVVAEQNSERNLKSVSNKIMFEKFLKI